MDDNERDRLIAELIDSPQDRERLLREPRLSDQDREDFITLLDIADEVWLSAQSAPPLEEDPVAAMLGLVSEPECRLVPGSLARARKRSRVTVSELAERLQRKGWDFDKGDIFRWETRTAADVPPAVIQAISAVLDTPVDQLVSSSASQSLPAQLLAALRDPLFKQLVSRWAAARNLSDTVAAAMLEGRMLATVHRGDPDTNQLLRSLEALVASVERSERKW
ncbi:hypothetical protein [Arthrobacter sp. SW1]|uniref:hypothetical protein n=1 Tax=Arthrobacter sp. SW1 TaxID=1920889 RepID=UPI0011131D7B|nr:hypothetical protein [Arthrobacter sp. SW1]